MHGELSLSNRPKWSNTLLTDLICLRTSWEIVKYCFELKIYKVYGTFLIHLFNFSVKEKEWASSAGLSEPVWALGGHFCSLYMLRSQTFNIFSQILSGLNVWSICLHITKSHQLLIKHLGIYLYLVFWNLPYPLWFLWVIDNFICIGSSRLYDIIFLGLDTWTFVMWLDIQIYTFQLSGLLFTG